MRVLIALGVCCMLRAVWVQLQAPEAGTYKVTVEMRSAVHGRITGRSLWNDGVLVVHPAAPHAMELSLKAPSGDKQTPLGHMREPGLVCVREGILPTQTSQRS